MKALFFGKALLRGVTTLEILIAFTLLTLSFASVVVLVFGSQAALTDGQIRARMLSVASAAIERMYGTSVWDMVAATSSIWVEGGNMYTHVFAVEMQTLCQGYMTSVVSKKNGIRAQEVVLRSDFTDRRAVVSLGRDCAVDVSQSAWSVPKVLATGLLPTGKPTAVDAFRGMVYGGSTESPYFFVIDASNVLLDKNSSSFISFVNAPTLAGPINTLDVVARPWGGVEKRYVYAGLQASSSQVAVVDVTDPYKPVTIATRSLLNVSPAGSEPAANKLYYYDDRLYVVTKYTAGPEFHTFDVSDPENPIELGSGVELGSTVNAIVVQERFVGGVRKRFAYMASSQLSGELKVYEVTDLHNIGAAVEVVAARQDMVGAQNGTSVYVLGTVLYMGRASTPSGPELYVFDASSPTEGLSLVASQDIAGGVHSITVVGNVAFITTSKSKSEVQVWDISTNAISLVSAHALSGAMVGGLDYWGGVLYATGQGSSSVEILSS